jgi:hypothetical protein
MIDMTAFVDLNIYVGYKSLFFSPRYCFLICVINLFHSWLRLSECLSSTQVELQSTASQLMEFTSFSCRNELQLLQIASGIISDSGDKTRNIRVLTSCDHLRV